MKNVMKKITLVLISIFALTTNVLAIEVSDAYDSRTDGKLYFNTPKGNGGYSSITVGSGDSAVTAYCMDPGAAAVNVGNDCTEEIISDTAFANQAAYIMSSDKSEAEKALAIRITSVGTGEANVRGKQSTGYERDNYCTYKNVVDQAGGKAGVNPTYSEGFQSKYDSYDCEGYSFSTAKDADGNDYGQGAIDLAADAMKASSTGASTPSNPKLKETSNSDGAVTISYSGVADGSTLTISCTTCNENGLTQTIGSSGSVTITTSAGAGATSCGTYDVTITPSGGGVAAGTCTQVAQYSCGGEKGGNVQQFVGCKETSDGTGVGGGGISLSGEIKCADSGSCTKDPKFNIASGAAAEALCDSTGTAIEVTELSEYTSTDDDVENCVLNVGELDATQAIVYDNKYCQVYCTEDYFFNAPGGLTNLDYDSANDQWYIASGSYFEFENPTITDTTNIACYSVNNVNLLLSDIATIADNTIVPAKTTRTYSCKTDPSTGEEIQVISTTEYMAIPDYSGLTIQIVEAGTYTEEVSGGCYATGTETGDIAGAKSSYQAQANQLVAEFEECNNWDLSGLKSQLEGECNPKVTYTYSDGSWIGITPIELEGDTVVSGSIIGRYDCNGSGYCESAAHSDSIDLGEGLSTNSFIASEYAELTGTIDNTYYINSVGICNNYNTGTSTYCVPGTADYADCVAECKPSEGESFFEGWPVEYDTTQGEYAYQFIVTGFGHDFSGGSCVPGRLEDLAYDEGIDTFDLECPYIVNNCGDCEWTCDPNGKCDGTDDCDEECIWECKEIGCVFDINNGLAINYSPISLLNPFNMAYLTDKHQGVLAVVLETEEKEESTIAAATDDKNGLAANWSSAKGTKALNEIKAAAENVYSGTPEYSITLNPGLINQIRLYNDAQEAGDNGGYLDVSLSCRSIDADGLHITCESNFLNGGIIGGSDFSRNTSWETYSDFAGISARKSGEGPAWK